jgi:type IV pilus assembly protein PilB
VIDISAGQTVQALLAAGLVTESQVDDAADLATQSSSTPLQVLIDTAVVDRRDVVRMAATSAGLAYVDLSEYAVNTSAAALLSSDFARRSNVLPSTGRTGCCSWSSASVKPATSSSRTT